MPLYLCVDLETGGLDCESCGITEIAAVVCERSKDWSTVKVVERFNVLVKPRADLQYTESALAVQHRTLADLEVGMSEECALLAFYGFLRGCTPKHPWQPFSPYAHNSDFDRGFLLEAHDRLNRGADDEEYIAAPYATDWRCTAALFKRLGKAGVHDCTRANLDVVMQHYGLSIPVDKRHTGIGDVEVLAELVGCMMRDWRQLPGQTREARIAGGTLGPGHDVVAP